ncbi:hypothetical protein OG429_00570 [Streptomyces sp. NBC_00190]|uniref:hypothetical protein n=1 Tax=unclassified Streptomyces TaxID=2593676 RepID=UPI002E28AAEB|nr:hypothetical protein [Streptomyces sp. NBC_00190]WSZ37975.1 hypothetical protein OG239_03540 [Streptomyces sp. NBC_00868]
MAQAPERTPAHPERFERGHPFRQWKTSHIPGTELTLTGQSRANDKTFFHLPELRCALDAGFAEGRQPETVFFIHTHHGHSKDLDFLAARPADVDIHFFGAACPDDVLVWAHPDSRLSEQHQHGGGRHG